MVAAYNKLRLTPRLAAGNLAALRTLQRTVRLEIGLVLAIFAATAALGQFPPPRTQASGVTSVTAEATSSTGSRVAVEINPAHVGRNEIFLLLKDGAGGPLAADEVTLMATLPSAGIEP